MDERGTESVARLQQAIQKMQAERHRKMVDEYAERQIQLNAGLFDKAAAYTNIIAVVGYAGFFGLWQLTKEYLTREAVLSSALAIGVSIVAFVMFEIGKMLWIQFALLKWQRTLQPSVRNGDDPSEVLKKFSELDRRTREAQADLICWWTVAFGVSVTAGLIGAGILLRSFVCGLVSG